MALHVARYPNKYYVCRDLTMETRLQLRLRPCHRDLEEWGSDWRLSNDYVACRACGYSQWPHEATKPFLHSSRCASSGAYNRYPWRELAWILNHIKSEE